MILQRTPAEGAKYWVRLAFHIEPIPVDFYHPPGDLDPEVPGGGMDELKTIVMTHKYYITLLGGGLGEDEGEG